MVNNLAAVLVFRGVEDLGGGLKASFWLEGSVAVDNGGTTFRFDRRSTIGLMGDFGEVRLGRDKLASYLTVETFDPFGDIGVAGSGANNMLGNATVAAGTQEGSHSKRASNIVSYLTPKMGGFHGQVQYGLGERASSEPNNSRGNFVSARVGYQSNPLDIALGYAQLKGGTAIQEVTYKALNLGASYDLGFVKPMLLIATERGAGWGVNAYTLGASAPVGQSGEFRVGYTRFNTRKPSRRRLIETGSWLHPQAVQAHCCLRSARSCEQRQQRQSRLRSLLIFPGVSAHRCW